MANRLANESSPYLLQHASNPVHWRPWDAASLEEAVDADKPIFLSIGYSACHWCHVMEHESFENAAIADYLNEHFISIKVDREERPDLDQIYMNAVQMLTGRGGWPMSVFLTPQLKPFFGGTYWPPTARGGMPGFDQVLRAVMDAWANRRAIALEQSEKFAERLQEIGQAEDSGEAIGIELLDQAYRYLESIYDFRDGGFGGAPKFPHTMDLEVCLRYSRRKPESHALEMVVHNLDQMARGGIYDHLGGGFARYSVDAEWLVPHFEKMLYDNALLTGIYVNAYRVTKRADFARVARETCDYVLNYLTDESGGFQSAEDADSEGEEGKFYVWSRQEIIAALGEIRGYRFCEIYDVSESGNFEGHNILNLPQSIEAWAAAKNVDAVELRSELDADRAKLLHLRDERIRPSKDDKVLTSWNGLMIESLAQAAGALGEPKYLAAAERAADFLFDTMLDPNGRLLHSYRQGVAKLAAYLDDYANLANACITLYEATFDDRWLDRAIDLSNLMIRHFADPAGGGFYFTADDHEQLIARNKDLYDNSVPSGNSMAAVVLLRLSALLGNTDLLDEALTAMRVAAPLMKKHPTATGQMLTAVDRYVGPAREVVILGDPESGDTRDFLAAYRQSYTPKSVIACVSPGTTPEEDAPLAPIFAGKSPLPDADGTVFICENFACQRPVTAKEAVANLGS
ncbi:thioredoxin domain-containing protein [Blastopirellula sp. JC732]|uniref:Thioredoxin domain-containing protein n=1 Tax=Blastopirellula sediminis TaxID=2894196 RepID=A0A9X1ML53_9BACT|nr:thioredoxin domain-containing protein [Blastopirellula sediminis]MCC9607694.1 thioredoxin domain-containing protein [Blastopirellula sediminis]MCC9629013.1 thioredoxin domain-containing protein [Blastopirellula sediminis]